MFYVSHRDENFLQLLKGAIFCKEVASRRAQRTKKKISKGTLKTLILESVKIMGLERSVFGCLCCHVVMLFNVRGGGCTRDFKNLCMRFVSVQNLVLNLSQTDSTTLQS